jgi:hypothetical protein
MISPVSEQDLYERCKALEISLAGAKLLADEEDKLDPLAIERVLGMNLSKLRGPRDWLWMAAQSSSTSYRTKLSRTDLIEILATGSTPSDFLSHVLHFFDEAPIQVIVMAVEQVSQLRSLPISIVWQNVSAISCEVRSRRDHIWAKLV